MRGCFLDVQEAYSVLGDARRRREYDERLSMARQPDIIAPHGWGERGEPTPVVSEVGPVGIGETSPLQSFQTFTPSFNAMFDWLWDNFSGMSSLKSEPVENLTLEVPLTQEQALRGGHTRVMVPVRTACPTCGGHGGFGPYECSRCAGEGAISGEIPVSIAFPAGLRGDHAVVIPLDRYGIHDLYLTVLFRPSVIGLQPP